MRKLSAGILRRCMAATLFLALAIALSSQTAQAASGQDKAREVVVGYTENGQMIQRTEKGYAGFGVSLLQSLSNYTGWTYRYVLVSEENRIQRLKNGEIDLLCDIDANTAAREGLRISRRQSGLEYGMICARKHDHSTFFGDISDISGKKIGINYNSGLEFILSDYAQTNEFTYEVSYFSNFEELRSALEAGKVDLMLSSSLRDVGDCRYVAKTGIMDVFFATGSRNTELMEELDAAADLLRTDQPFYLGGLYETFYGRPSETLQDLTKPEFNLIHNGESVRVACLSDNYPMEYFDEQSQSCKGIYVDAMEVIARESGLKFEYIPVTDVGDAREKLSEGKYDLMLAGYDVGTAGESGSPVRYSKPYLSMEQVLITRHGAMPGEHVTAALSEKYSAVHSYIAKYYPAWEIRLLPDEKSCLEAVEQGTADVTVTNTILLQTVYNLNNYKTLAIVPSKTITIPVSIAIGKKNAELMQQILNKTIAKIPAAELEQCISENAINIFYEPEFADIFKRYIPHIAILLAVVVLAFIISLKLRENHFRHLAMTDALTGIWNGAKFRSEAGQLLNKNKQDAFVVVSLDIDKFKFVNNDFGIQTADRILCMFAERIRQEFTDKALYARDMADMFLLMLKPCDDLEERLERLTREFTFENNGKQQSYKSSLKFGICEIAPRERQEEIAPYINRAFIARKSIKNVSGVSISYYNKEMADSVAYEMEIEKRMVEALKNGEFLVYYQPKYNLHTGRITGAEALVRWNSQEMGFIYPDSFIPVFEKNGFIIEMDFYVYEEVLKKLAQWNRAGREPMCVSVNVSRAHIETGCFLKRLCDLVERCGVEHRYLELELTETILGSKRANIQTFIKSCKDAGFKVSIDDFGSGYSSLNLLKKLPVDVLKIDKEFLDEAEESERSSIIVEQVVQMARRIHISTLCEGVETKKQETFLKKIGCDMAQGYLYSKPIVVEEFEQLIVCKNEVEGEK